MGNKLKLSNYVIASDSIFDRKKKSSIRVLYSTRTGSCLNVPEATWYYLQKNQIFKLAESIISSLKKGKFLVNQEEDELTAIIYENQKEIEDNNTLFQVIQPSAWCQLDCGYCGQEHGKKQLSEAAQHNFLMRYEDRLRTGRYNKVRISWFGAEPTTGIKVMRFLTPKLIEIASRYHCKYSAKIVTNGLTLSARLADELFNFHKIIEAEVTLDGSKSYHDKRRMTKQSRPSFDRIFQNVVEVAQRTRLPLTIRCNVDKSNSESVPYLIKAIAKKRLQKRVRFYTAPIHSWGNDAHKNSLSKEEYAKLEIEWIALQISTGFNVGLLPPRKKIVCMAVQKNSELIDAYDYSFNCTEVSQVPFYGTPNKFAIRTPSQGKRHSDKAERLSQFNDDILSGDQPQCKDCKMLPVCGGQCPKAWHEGHTPCPSPKFNIKERLNILYAIQKIEQL